MENVVISDSISGLTWKESWKKAGGRGQPDPVPRGLYKDTYFT